MNMESKTILITGATAGIGRHTALYLARRGHRVIATGRNEKALADLKAAANGSVETVRLDVTSKESIADAKTAVDALTGGRGIDVLVNNAGYGVLGPTALITDEDVRAQYETNVFGLMAVTRAFITQMMNRGSGRIVNVSSVGGRITLPLFGVYNSTKYAVESLSDALRVELAPFGIQVSLVEPGYIATNFTERSLQEVSKYQTPDSPYAPVLARIDQLTKAVDKTAVGPQTVARAIERAATSRRPSARYVAPGYNALGIFFMRLMPTSWLDFVMGRLIGLTRRRLAKSLPASSSLQLGHG
jgi:NAD(P)-dependent dehydrogenase (short-subunit alcohol dehydrogenase family)